MLSILNSLLNSLMAVTESQLFQGTSPPGIRPLEVQWFWTFIDDEEGLDSLNDEVKLFKLATGSTLLDGLMILGDHDTGSAVTHSLILNAAVDGNAAADHEIILDSTIGQGGGVARAAGTDVDALGRRIEADGAYVSIKTTTAPTGAQTDDRKVVVGILVGNYPPGAARRT